MLEKLNKNEQFEYQKLSAEEMSKRGILGRLVGPSADFINPTRNGRKYTEELWDKVFQNPIIQEKIKNKVFIGELGHNPENGEMDPTKAAIILSEAPKKNADGQLMAVFDILDTPNGRIVKTLAEYGSNLGISSRATGDIIYDDNGEEIVDPDTFELEGWDVVLVPGVESARLSYVNESLEKKKPLRTALLEEYSKASADDKVVMKETLHALDIEVEEQIIDSKPQEGDDIKQTTKEEEVANNDGADEDLIKSLQEALKVKVDLETQVKSLQEQLAVNSVKVEELNEEVKRYKQATTRLSIVASEKKQLQEEFETLKESLAEKENAIAVKDDRIRNLIENQKRTTASTRTLQEELTTKKQSVEELNESLEKARAEAEDKVRTLTESIEELKGNFKAIEEKSKTKLDRTEKLVEGYKKQANEIMSHYIKTRADMLGITPQEIKNRLTESYTIQDVDSICEDLQSYELNISKLPFDVSRKQRVQIRESKNEHLTPQVNQWLIDDEVDDTLRALVSNTE